MHSVEGCWPRKYGANWKLSWTGYKDLFILHHFIYLISHCSCNTINVKGSEVKIVTSLKPPLPCPSFLGDEMYFVLLSSPCFTNFFIFSATMAPELLFADIKSIRRYELTTGIYDDFMVNLTRIVALDFDVRSGKIFFTDVTENKIYSTHFSSKPSASSEVFLFHCLCLLFIVFLNVLCYCLCLLFIVFLNVLCYCLCLLFIVFLNVLCYCLCLLFIVFLNVLCYCLCLLFIVFLNVLCYCLCLLFIVFLNVLCYCLCLLFIVFLNVLCYCLCLLFIVFLNVLCYCLCLLFIVSCWGDEVCFVLGNLCAPLPCSGLNLMHSSFFGTKL